MRFLLSWQRLALAAGAALLLLFAYGSVLTRGPFGINDDYQYLYRVHAGTFDPAHNEQTGMGRPLASWGFEAAYALCGGQVARLLWLRAFALAGIGLFSWTLFSTLRALRCSRVTAGTVAALVALSPACGVYAAWAAAMFSPYALAAALFAGRLLLGPADWRRDVAGGLLLVAACAVWQAAAPLALFPALAEAWQPPVVTNKKSWWRPWLVCGIAAAVYAALCWLIYTTGLVPASATQRLTLSTDPAAKLRLLGDLLRSGVTSWARLQPGFWDWTVGGLSVGAGLCSLVARENGRWQWTATGRRAAVAATMLLLSVLPLLAARENNAAFRSLPGLYLVVAFLGVEGLGRLLRARPTCIRLSLPLALVAASTGAARYHVWHGLVEPNVREYTGVRDQIRRQFPDGPPARLVYLVPPYTLLGEEWMTTSWEYGLVSSTFWWVTRPFLRLAFADASPPGRRPADPTISYRETGNPPGTPVLDSLPALLREPGRWRDDPLWGHLRAHRRGWRYSPWFGYFNVGNFPFVQHHLLGTLVFSSQAKDGADLWFYHDGLGHFYTAAPVYPALLLGGSDRWVSLSDDGPGQLYLVDKDTKQRLPYPP